MAILLAAGEGRRMGLSAPKALLEYAPGQSFLAHLSATFMRAGCDAVWVVTGSRAVTVERLHPALTVARNRRWKDGQYSSVRAGLRAALRAGADVVSIHPVDLPRVRPGSVRRLLAALRRTPSGAAVATFEDRPAHPVALTRAAAEKVLAMGDVPHLRAALERLGPGRVPVDDPGVLAEVDTPEDHLRLFGRAPRLVLLPRRATTTAAARRHT